MQVFTNRLLLVLDGMHVCCLHCRYGIRCNVVLPGFIQTNMTGEVPENIKDQVNFELCEGCIGGYVCVQLCVLMLWVCGCMCV